MPEYGTPFDPTTPTDANWLHEGDDRIREIKAALIERFVEFFEDFPGGNPLLVSDATIRDIASRLDAVDRPTIAPVLSLVEADVRKVRVVGNTPVRSIKLERVGGTWSTEADGTGGVFVVPVPAETTWTVRVTGFAAPLSEITGETLYDQKDVVVQGVYPTGGNGGGGEPPTPPPGADIEFVKLEVSQPAIGSTQVTVTTQLTGTLTGHTARFYYQERWWQQPQWSLKSGVIHTRQPPPADTDFTFTHFASLARIASGDLFYDLKIIAEVTRDSDGLLVKSMERVRSWAAGNSSGGGETPL